MQASTNSLDTMVKVDTTPSNKRDTKGLDDSSINDPSANSPAFDESKDFSKPPFVLESQQEDNLSIDIIKLYQNLLPSKDSYDKRIKFVNRVEHLLNEEWPDHDIKANVFGSSVNDLGTSSSDVDLCITTAWNGLKNVRLLAKLFRKCGMQHVVCVPRAKVPIVRLFDPGLQLSCDINVNNTLALQNTKMIKTYVALDSRVRPLIMTIKHWTKQRLLNDAANGGTLSSYTWTCMIINFLQQRQPPILPVLHEIEHEGKTEDYFFSDVEKLRDFGLANKESLGGLLFAFFRRFAIEFDYDDQVVSVRQGRYLSKKEKGWDTGRNKMSLCVEEPFNVSRNLGNSADVASVHGLRREFQRFLDLLLAGDDLELICSLYQPVVANATNATDIPISSSSLDSGVLSLTLPAENRTSSFFLPIHPHANYAPLVPTRHPYDRRKSMVDGICSYPSHILSDSYSNTHFPLYTCRAPLVSKPPQFSLNTFHPRFSSPQALDSILRVRNTRHGSHPLPPVPSTLLSVLNISANHGKDQSVDRIFARYQRKRQAFTTQQQKSYSHHPHTSTHHATDRKSSKKLVGNSYQRKNAKDNNSVNNAGNGNSSHHYQERKPRRRSSGLEWPAISASISTTATLPSPDAFPQPSWSSEQPQRLRRWSTTKQQQIETAISSEPKRKTLAEIVKVHTPPPPPAKPKPQSPAASMSMSSNKSHGKSSNRRQKNTNGNSRLNSQVYGNGNNKPKKKNISIRP
ncbi:hypothetical protein [Parasitella parasitica]|uniref:polynucleotide adenylyltransferase n=1 Tax=Parasitella parasitica TaxID=35722 RepID=A0A0B7NBY9_9FUNG|nr:hypothetical protein [Parasitella parasitica]